MGQYWKLLNLDRRETAAEIGGKLGECFSGGFYQLTRILTVLHFPKGELPPDIEEWLSSGRTALQPGPFGKLAPEMLEAIYDGLTEFQDIACLFITCRLLMSGGKRRLRSAIRERVAPWIGCRLICLGDYSADDKLPKGLLTDDEIQELTALKGNDIEDGDGVRNFYGFAATTYRRASETDGIAIWNEGLRRLLRHLPPDVPWEMKDLDPTIRADLKRFARLFYWRRPTALREKDTVLCNLSKSEYVRKNGLTVQEYGLAQALLTHICWSEDSSFSLPLSEETSERMVHGRWAGDRFLITTLEELPDAPKDREWADVTEEIDAILVEIWEGENS